ncbi:MAG: DUF4202 family protein [Deltaproteobacteria bacterium]|nr:DUF4202 family protein [Deltaproteobacteria bacterium]
MSHVECTQRKIRTIISHSAVPEDPIHAENTLDWLLRLEPGADMALQIAALGHDVERALEDRRIQKRFYTDFDAFKAAHARNSADIMNEIMTACEVPQTIVDDVYQLICRHETGGDARSDLLRDVDSISFFDVNLPLYYKRNGREETFRRSIWGYRRISQRRKNVLSSIVYEHSELNVLLKDVIDIAQSDRTGT